MTDVRRQAEAQRSAAFWGSVPDTRTIWNHPLYARYQEKRWGEGWEVVLRRIGKKESFDSAFCIGCGTGPTDVTYYDLGLFKEFVGADLSNEALEVARSKVGKRPLRYVQADFNDPLPAAIGGPFDLIYANGALHHVRDLELLFSEVSQKLTDDGIFSWVEYCGPVRFQWTPKVQKIANAILSILPPHLKGDFTQIYRPRYHEIMATDPSESVRGPEIVDLTHLFFDVIEEKNLGSTISHPVLNSMLRNFNDADPMQNAIIELIFLFEETLIDEGVIESDSKMAVARKRK